MLAPCYASEVHCRFMTPLYCFPRCQDIPAASTFILLFPPLAINSSPAGLTQHADSKRKGLPLGCNLPSFSAQLGIFVLFTFSFKPTLSRRLCQVQQTSGVVLTLLQSVCRIDLHSLPTHTQFDVDSCILCDLLCCYNLS